MHEVRRRTLLGLGLAAAAVTTLPACSKSKSGGTGAKPSDGGQGGSTTWPAHIDPKTIDGAFSPQPAGLPPLYTGPVKEYFASTDKKPGDGSEVTTYQLLWGAPPQGKAKNKFWQALEKELNITYKPTFNAMDTYSDKLSTLVASGDLPDILFVIDDHAQTKQAIEDGAFADLTDVLAGDNIKKWPNLANISTQVWKNSAKKGRIMGIPPELAPVNVMWVVRDDILTKAGWSEAPKDTDDFLALIKALVSMKTFAGKQFWPMGGLEWLNQKFLEGMWRIGPQWALKEGKVVSALENENYPKFLEFCNKLYKAGAWHPDGFGAASKEPLFGEGQLAMSQSGPGGYLGLIEDVPNKTKGATVKFMSPKAYDGGEPEWIGSTQYWGLNVISAKAAKDEKRLHMLLDILNYWRGPYGSKENLFLNNGVEGVNYKFDGEHNVVRIDTPTDQSDQGAVSFLGIGSQPVWTLPPKHKDKAANMMETAEKYLKASDKNELMGLTAPSEGKLGSKLSTIDTDYRVSMIVGRRPLTDYKAFVDAYMKAGGETLRKEIQQAYEDRKAGK